MGARSGRHSRPSSPGGGAQRPPRQPQGGQPQGGEPVDDEEFDDEDLDDDYMRFGDGGDVGYFDDYDPRNTFTGDQAYNNAVSRTQLAKTYYTKPLIDFTKNSTLFPDTKEQLIAIIQGLFDKTEVLAKTTNLKLEIIEANIVLMQAKISFHPSDVDNPTLTTIFNMALKHYGRYISRSEQGWERGLQNVMETSHTQTISDNRGAYQNVASLQKGQQKRPWWRKWF